MFTAFLIRQQMSSGISGAQPKSIREVPFFFRSLTIFWPVSNLMLGTASLSLMATPIWDGDNPFLAMVTMRSVMVLGVCATQRAVLRLKGVTAELIPLPLPLDWILPIYPQYQILFILNNQQLSSQGGGEQRGELTTGWRILKSGFFKGCGVEQPRCVLKVADGGRQKGKSILQGLALFYGSLSSLFCDIFPHVLISLHIVLMTRVKVASLAEIIILTGEAMEPSAQDRSSPAAITEIPTLRGLISLTLLQIIHRVLHRVKNHILIFPYMIKMAVGLDLL